MNAGIKTSKCRACGALIVWITTENGKKMPCDAYVVLYWEKEKAKGKIVTSSGRVISCELAGEPGTESGIGYIPHWATCPKAKDFKGGARR